jgi:hypothetical protein
MRFTTGLAVAAVLGAVACKKNDGTVATGSGSGSAVVSTPPAVPPPDAASPAAGGSLRATALDDALGAKGIDLTSVAVRAATPTSQWAAVKTKIKVTTGGVLTYTLWRATPAGVTTFDLLPPPGGASSWFNDLSAIDVKDVDGDHVDDAVITARWSRRFTGKLKAGEVTTLEEVEAVYVVGGARLAVGAQHASAYKTETNLEPGENEQPAESIAFTYALVPGPPPVLHATMGASDVLPKTERLKGLLDPKRDPWLTPGDLPIVFK